MFYTYSHSAPNGKVFYIGKGVNDRAFSFKDRSHDWKRAVKSSNGVQVKILAEWSTEKEAYDHEMFLISCFKDMGYALVNKTGGGAGPFGVKVSEEMKQLKSNQMTGYVHKKITCPNCGTSGGETSMKRWHFDKCTGAKTYKARVTINGKRIFLGNFATKDKAKEVQSAYLKDKL